MINLKWIKCALRGLPVPPEVERNARGLFRRCYRRARIKRRLKGARV